MEIDNDDNVENGSKIQPNEDAGEKSLPSKRKSKQVFESSKKKNSKKKK